MTHNNFLDQSRRLVKAAAFPSPLDETDLLQAAMLIRNAREAMALAFRLLERDNTLRIHAETAGQSVRRLLDSTCARLAPVSGEKA